MHITTFTWWLLHIFPNAAGKTVVDGWVIERESLRKLEERQDQLEAIIKVQQTQIEQLLNDTNSHNRDTEKQCVNNPVSVKTIKKTDGSLFNGQYLLWLINEM